MKKILFALLMILVVSFALISCGGQGGSDEKIIDRFKVVDGELIIYYTDGTSQNLGKIDLEEDEDKKDDEVVGSEGLEYFPLDDGTYAVSAGKTGLLSEIVIPSTYSGKAVTQIKPYGFRNASNLKKITMPASITSIGESAFENCKSLTSIEVPDSVTSIGKSAFENCNSLTSIEIPDGVTSIGECVFLKCTSLTSIEIPDSVTSIGKSAFSACHSLTSIEIPDGVTIIEYSVFFSCKSLSSIEIPNGVTTIEEGAFDMCTSLTSIEIPESVTSIGKSAFERCTSLTSIEIPDSVMSMGKYAFYCSDSLTIYCKATNVPSGWETEWNYSNCPVYWYSENEPTEEGNWWHYVNGEITIW